MHAKPNIVLIMTDQQRADTIGALGSPWMQTPHLDRLVNEGTSFTNCFVTSPVCVSSRASVFLGGYPHTTNVYTNFETWEPNWVQWLANAGYHCVNIGKMHINPYDAKGGFHQRFFVENKDRPLFLEDHERALYDEWDKALKARGLEKPSRYTRVRDDRDAFLKNLGCFTWETDSDTLQISFAGNTLTMTEKFDGDPECDCPESAEEEDDCSEWDSLNNWDLNEADCSAAGGDWKTGEECFISVYTKN